MAKSDVWFELKDLQGNVVVSDRVKLTNLSTVPDFRDVVQENYCAGVQRSTFNVYTSENGTLPLLNPRKVLGDCGGDNSFVVRVSKVWFKLVDLSGDPSRGANGAYVLLSERNSVEQLQGAVKMKYRESLLVSVEASQLQVYTNWEAFTSKPKQGLLQADGDIGENGNTLANALIVVIPKLNKRPANEEEEFRSPAKRGKPNTSTEWNWPKEDEPSHCVKYANHLVTILERAIEKLLICHKNKFYRGEIGGLKWSIPLVDQGFDLEESTFADEYIRRCRQKWESLPKAQKRKGDFEDVIRSCHTIRALLTSTDIQGEDGGFDGMKADDNLVRHICQFFDKRGNRPRSLAPEALLSSSSIVLDNLTMEVGPMLIVLDEIDTSFEFGQDVENNDTDMIRGKRLIQFCEVVLLPLMPVEKVFFVIAGRATFLNYVDGMYSSSFSLTHLDLSG